MRSPTKSAGQAGLAADWNALRQDAYGASMLLAHQQSSPGLTLYVEPGVCYITATRLIFAGGNSPSFSAPSAGNKRIDLLTIDSSGTIAITQGTPTTGTPSAPTYPTDGKIVLAEVYCRAGMTSVKDIDDTTNAYIYNDVRPVLNFGIQNEGQINPTVIKSLTGGQHVYASDAGSANTYAITVSPVPASYTAGDTYSFLAGAANTGASTLNVNSLGAKTIKKNYNVDLVANDIKAGQIITVIYDGTYFQIPTPSVTQGYVDARSNTIFNNGVATHVMNQTNVQTIAHGLGITPKFLRIIGYPGSSGSAIYSIGSFNGTNYACIYNGSGLDTSHIIVVFDGNPAYSNVATVTWDATNFYLHWSGSGFGATAQFMWEAYY